MARNYYDTSIGTPIDHRCKCNFVFFLLTKKKKIINPFISCAYMKLQFLVRNRFWYKNYLNELLSHFHIEPSTFLNLPYWIWA
jgi:hypothetical protein